MHDIVTLTALNTIVGNIDDYATQWNNYYIFFPKDGWLIRFFGVDFDTINPAQKSRDYMLAHHIHPLYDIVIAHPLYLTTKSILGTVVE
jgi:spore coat protein CotH